MESQIWLKQQHSTHTHCDKHNSTTCKVNVLASAWRLSIDIPVVVKVAHIWVVVGDVLSISCRDIPGNEADHTTVSFKVRLKPLEDWCECQLVCLLVQTVAFGTDAQVKGQNIVSTYLSLCC